MWGAGVGGFLGTRSTWWPKQQGTDSSLLYLGRAMVTWGLDATRETHMALSSGLQFPLLPGSWAPHVPRARELGAG